MSNFHKGEDGTVYLERPNSQPDDQDYGYLLPLTEKLALEAANRVIHGEGSEDDKQLAAGYLIQLLSSQESLRSDPLAWSKWKHYWATR